METGVVKWFSLEKAYGFLASDNGGPDVFVHINDLVPGVQLREGDRVSYDKGRARDGRIKAVNIRLV